MNKNLYEQDFHLWIQSTIHQLKERDFNLLDIEHLIEELVDLGKSDKTSLESNLEILLAHLLKLKVQNDVPETMQAIWYSSVDEHRSRIKKQMSKIPSLKPYLVTVIPEVYPDARKLAIKEGKRAKFGVHIPDEKEYDLTCPFSVEQILDEFYGL